MDYFLLPWYLIVINCASFFQSLIFSQQIFTLVALMPPVVIAVFTHDVGQLVALTVSVHRCVLSVWLFLDFYLGYWLVLKDLIPSNPNL